jgi:ribonuclease D
LPPGGIEQAGSPPQSVRISRVVDRGLRLSYAPDLTVPRAIFVDQIESLTNVVEALRTHARVALDTEVNAMYTYRPRVCLVQLAVADPEAPSQEVFVIDTLVLGTLAPLAPLLGNDPACTPIIHDVAYDSRMLLAGGQALLRATDTALHARYLGLATTGLGGLLQERFNVTLDKELQRADWGKRPLTDAQIEYVTSDVAFLGPLAAQLEREAIAKGVHEEILVETEWALASARAKDPDAPPEYAEQKGLREMTPEGRAVWRALWLLREREAAKRDVPPGKVVSSQALLAIARARPRDLHAFRRMTGTALEDDVAQAFVDAIAEGEREGDVPEEDRRHFVITRSPSGEIARRRAREECLAQWRAIEAEARGVNMQVVLPGHVLSEIAKVGPTTAQTLAEIPGFGEVRVRRYADAILSALAAARA